MFKIIDIKIHFNNFEHDALQYTSYTIAGGVAAKTGTVETATWQNYFPIILKGSCSAQSNLKYKYDSFLGISST